jgi:hypothetical protein
MISLMNNKSSLVLLWTIRLVHEWRGGGLLNGLWGGRDWSLSLGVLLACLILLFIPRWLTASGLGSLRLLPYVYEHVASIIILVHVSLEGDNRLEPGLAQCSDAQKNCKKEKGIPGHTLMRSLFSVHCREHNDAILENSKEEGGGHCNLDDLLQIEGGHGAVVGGELEFEAV